MRRSFAPLVVLSLLLASSAPATATAQSSNRKTTTTSAKRQAPSRESDERPPRLAAGMSVGTVQFADGRSEHAVSGVLQYQPLPWLALSMSPAAARATYYATDSAQTPTAASGLTDLPLAVAVSHTADDARWSPTLAATLGVALAVGDSAKGLGSGKRSVGLSLAAGVAPADAWYLSLGASRALTGGATQSGTGTADATAIDFGASRDIGERLSASLSLSADVRRADSTYSPGRVLAVGVAYAVSGPLTLTVDGGRGLTDASPRWLLSIGLGTAFAGVSPSGAASPLQRIRQTVAPGSTTGQTGSTAACHAKKKTC
jgi:hypothetical protein